MADALPPPRFLSAEAAAAYVGVDVRTFRAEVRAGLWPAPVTRGTREAWDRAALDRRADAMSGLASSPAAQPGEVAKAAEAAWMRRLGRGAA
jgi:hypothetical protein